MRRRKAGVRSLAVAAALLTGGCDVYYYEIPSPDNLWHIIPWFDHMITARYVRPYETAGVPRYTIHGTVPVSGGEPDWAAEWVSGKTTTVDTLRNPFARAGEARPAPAGPEVPELPREVEAAGDSLYQNFCTVCHGVTGDGKGPVGNRVGAPSLLTGRARSYSDGYLYSIIRYGRGVMPRYGDKVYRPADRWAIVTHLRKLQAASPAPQEPAGATAGIPPAPSATGSTGERPR
ncbi:MAG TPA: cytochrome c [Gemmatimonadales bacterium]|nr:cytochrome c [Gemmatimonadales bacterium]